SKLKLEKALADSLVAHCETALILPDDFLRVAMNQKSKEPFILDGRKLGGRSETERMIRILSTLWKTDSESFDRAAEGVGGHIRLWVSRDRRQISNTGSSNYCRPSKDSPRYVSINC